MIITIDTEDGRVNIDGKEWELSRPSDKVPGTIADAMELFIGAKEWDDTTRMIQEWYYGSFVKDAWCTTGLSYFADVCHVIDQTGKHENVDKMKDYMNKRKMLDCTANYGGGSYKAKRGDVIFFSSKYTYRDCTHVGVISEINHDTGYVKYCSCNSKDSIRWDTRNYITDKYVVAFGRVNY